MLARSELQSCEAWGARSKLGIGHRQLLLRKSAPRCSELQYIRICNTAKSSRTRVWGRGASWACQAKPNDDQPLDSSNGNGRSDEQSSATPAADVDKSWTNRRRQYIVDEWIDAFDLPLSDHLKKSQPMGLFNGSWSWRDVGERIAYRYFCWRQDTWSDLQLFGIVNLGVIFLFSWLKAHLVDVADSGVSAEDTNKPFWTSLYQILQVIFGQELPDEATSFAQQAFAVGVAAIGLAAFALVLALVEQVVLQVVDENVARGSKVFETGHILVLGFCDTQRDLEVVQKILSQTCHAYESEGGRVIVVMTQRDKIGMEALFRRVIPPHKRLGSQFVFRQGSPLVPADLKMVSASSAAATVIVSDSSRAPVEADSETIRAAILLDELESSQPQQGLNAGRIIVEVKTLNALSVLQFSCSVRVMALHTGEMNARRLSRMVRSPIVAAISYVVYNYSCRPQVYLQLMPSMAGKTFGELAFHQPQATAYGLVQSRSRRCLLNPPAETLIDPLDEIVMIRATDLSEADMLPLPEPVPMDLGDWHPSMYKSAGTMTATSLDWGDQGPSSGQAGQGIEPAELPSAFVGAGNGLAATVMQERQASYMYIMPQEHIGSKDSPEAVLICGWRDEAFMSDMLREMDHGPSALPVGSQLTLFNASTNVEIMARVKTRNRLRNVEVTWVCGNPLDPEDLAAKVDVTGFSTAIVLCDQSWVDPDLDDTNGIQVREQRDMLRLESQILLVQLHIRKSLAEAGFPDINIICEKVAAEGETRFEDRYRLPIGISVNMTSFSAKLLTSAIYNPRNIMVFSQMGDGCELDVQSAAVFAQRDEELSYWQLQARAQSVGRILFGYYAVPDSSSVPIDFVINLEGNEERSKKRVWNDGKTQLILLCPRARQSATTTAPALRSMEQLVHSSSSKLVSCGSLMPWMPQDYPSRPAWASTDDGDDQY